MKDSGTHDNNPLLFFSPITKILASSLFGELYLHNTFVRPKAVAASSPSLSLSPSPSEIERLFDFPTFATNLSIFFSTTNLERPTTRRLPLLGSAFLGLGPRAAKHLQEVGGAPAHAAVDVGFAGLDVVVEVVAEGLDVGDDFFAARWGQVAGEEDWSCMLVRSLVWM